MSFLSCEEMLAAARSQKITLAEAVLRSDLEESRLTEEQSRAAMHHLWQVMQATSREYDPAQRSRSGLSGGDAAKVEQAHKEGKLLGGDYLSAVTAEALKTAECNACMKRIVAAPTAGSCGVLPAVLLYLQDKYKFTDEKIAEALSVAGLLGCLIKRNASVSGAECGCQAEIGSACSMAAAAMSQLMGLSIQEIEYSAEIAMEHHLGLTCDPICGLVQIPCIERNAVAAKRAIDSANLAHMLVGTRTISFDMVVRTMYETGISMNRAFRETSEGGLARLYSRRAGTAPTRK